LRWHWVKRVGRGKSQFITTLVLPFFEYFAQHPGRTAGPIAICESSKRVFSAKEVTIGGLDDEK